MPTKIKNILVNQWNKNEEQDIALIVLKILQDLINKNKKITSGTADKIFRVLNRIYFNVSKNKGTEPTSFQRNLIENKYPKIFPKNQKK